ncbi:hypothetical protein FDP41_003043 [Naegleria fowleri]|uniref:Uncharacterized protein n=1 Tax=Naegleria fowleri TaxID=5763 RepID=A0A6A5BTP8_NAEFO|nr:uncharacterized protein FDP41_003043 [Naegleria fowleri]KAF0977721.1 hypothetical protein FDP41_003043 [Naegleria fowleri]
MLMRNPSSIFHNRRKPFPPSITLVFFLIIIVLSSLAFTSPLLPSSNNCKILPLSLSYPVHPDCSPGEYCSAKSLKCLLITQHPKWNLNCSRNQVQSSRVCGEFPITTTASSNNPSSRETLLKQQIENDYQQNVLQCIHHKCRQCEEQSRNFSNGMICVNGVWQFERYSNSIVDSYYDLVFKRDATSIVLVVGMAVFLFITIVSLGVDVTRIIQRKRQVAELEMEMASNEEFMEYYSKVMEKEKSKRAKKLKERMKALNGNIMSSSDDDEEDNHEEDEEEECCENVELKDGGKNSSNNAHSSIMPPPPTTSANEAIIEIDEEQDHQTASQHRAQRATFSVIEKSLENARVSSQSCRPLPLTPIQRRHQKSLQKAIERAKLLNSSFENNGQPTTKREEERHSRTMVVTPNPQPQRTNLRPLPSKTLMKSPSTSHHSDSDEY